MSATQDRASFTCVPLPQAVPGISVLPAHLICLPSLRSLLLEVLCLETHRFIDCGVIFVVSGGRGNLVPDVPFWPEVEVCFLVFTST